MIAKIKRFLFENQGTRKTISKNLFWLLTSNVGSRALKGIVVIYAARVLGAAQYGVVSYIFGLAGFFIFFKNMGVDLILAREVARSNEERHAYFSTAFWIEMVLIVITALLLLFVAPHFSHVVGAAVLIPLVTAMLLFEDMRELFLAFFRGMERMEFEALIIIIANIATVILTFSALSISPTPYALVAAYAASAGISLCIAGYLLRDYIRGVIGNFKAKLIAPILHSAWPIAFMSLSGTFLSSIDVVMLGWWRTPEEIGLYSAGQKLAGILTAFAGVVGTAMFPAISRFAHDPDQGKMRDLGNNIFKIMFLIAMPLVVGGVLLGTPLMLLFFGTGYVGGGSVFIILLVSLLASYPAVVMTSIIFAYDLQKKTLVAVVVSAAVNTLLNIVLIPRYGIEGSAFASLLSLMVSTYILWRATRRIVPFNLFFGFSKICIAVIVMALVVIISKSFGIPMLVIVAMGAVTYIGMLYLAGEDLVRNFTTVIRRSNSS